MVGDWCDWFVSNYESIPESEMAIVRRELKEAFKQDDNARDRHWDWKPLGMDCDRKQWERVLQIVGGGRDDKPRNSK